MAPSSSLRGRWGEALPLVALSLVLAGVAGFGTQSVRAGLFRGGGAACDSRLPDASANSRCPPLLPARTNEQFQGQFPIRFAGLSHHQLSRCSGRASGLDLVLGAFVAGAVLRTLLPEDLHDDLMQRLSAVGYGFLIPIFFVTSGTELDIGGHWQVRRRRSRLVPVFVVMMLLARGVPALILYRDALTVRQRIRAGLSLGHAAAARGWPLPPSRWIKVRCRAGAAPRW